MKFQTLGQYFYKLYALMFILFLVPLAVFIFLYQSFRLAWLPTFDLLQMVELISYLAFSIAAFDWVIILFVFHYRLKSIRKIHSLGERLSRYASLTLVSNTIISVGMLVLSGGYYLTENKWMTIVFIASLILPVIRWPFPSRVCKDLALKGDEQMMVLYRMDSF